MAELLTDARRALLLAFRSWSETKDAFKRIFDFEKNSEGMKDVAPALSDLPCLSLFPVQVNPQWWVTGIQVWPYSLQADIWVRDWYLPPAEKLIHYLINAAFRAKPNGSECTIIETSMSRIAQISNLNFERVLIDNVKMIKASVVFTLTTNYSPFGS